MTDPDILTFEAWADPVVDSFGIDPESTLSRLAWLPIIGPTSWLLWGTLATQLRAERVTTWTIESLGAAHGIARGTGRHAMVRRTLDRLEQFHLAAPVEGHRVRWLIRLSVPPLRARQLDRLPAHAVALHAQAYAGTRRAATG